MLEIIHEISRRSRNACVDTHALNQWLKLLVVGSVLRPAKQQAITLRMRRQAELITPPVVIRATPFSMVEYRLVFPATGDRLVMAVPFGSCPKAVTVNTTVSRCSLMASISVWPRPAT